MTQIGRSSPLGLKRWVRRRLDRGQPNGSTLRDVWTLLRGGPPPSNRPDAANPAMASPTMPSVSGAGSLIRPVSLHISDTLSSQCPASPCPGDGLGREPGALSDS
jgi:hypothetical protein